VRSSRASDRRLPSSAMRAPSQPMVPSLPPNGKPARPRYLEGDMQRPPSPRPGCGRAASPGTVRPAPPALEIAWVVASDSVVKWQVVSPAFGTLSPLPGRMSVGSHVAMTTKPTGTYLIDLYRLTPRNEARPSSGFSHIPRRPVPFPRGWMVVVE